MTVVLNHLSFGIDKVELQPAELRTLSTVCRTLETVLRGIALPAIAYAQRSMYKDFKLHVGVFGVYLGYLIYRQLTGEHHTLESKSPEPLHLVGGAVVGLGAGMHLQTYVTQHGDESHVLHENGIRPSFPNAFEQTAHTVYLVVINDGVYRDIHPCAKLVCIAAEPGDVVCAVTRGGTSTEMVGTNIHGIGTMVDGSYATFQVFCRCQQFQCLYVPILNISHLCCMA